MMKRFLQVLLAFTAMLSLSLPAEAAMVKASLDSTWVTIGCPRMLHLEVTVPEGTSVQWPSLSQAGGIDAFDYQDSQKHYHLEFGPDVRFVIDSLTQNGQVTYSQDLQIFAFDSAAMVISPISFVINGTDTLKTDFIALKSEHPFVEIPDDPQATQPLKDILQPEFVLWDYIWWLPYVLLAVILLALAVWLVRRYLALRSEAPVAAPVEKALPPHVVAMSALDELKGKHLWQEGLFKAYHTELTDILRTYIEGRFSVSALEKTSDEILEELVELQITQKSSYNSLRDVLRLADLVKFAKFQPLPDENQMSLVNARLFVEQTKPTEITGTIDDAVKQE